MHNAVIFTYAALLCGSGMGVGRPEKKDDAVWWQKKGEAEYPEEKEKHGGEKRREMLRREVRKSAEGRKRVRSRRTVRKDVCVCV